MDREATDSGQTIILHDSGDALLLIGTSDSQQSVLVSKTAMTLASPVWKAMFDRQIWAESSATEIPFPEDDVDAMLIILRIAHLRFRDLPPRKSLTLEGLLNLAVLCDKYDMASVVKPFLDLHRWAEAFVPETKVGKEKNCDTDWFFIAWTFGYSDSFEALAKYVLLRVHMDREGVPLFENEEFPDHMPPGILDSMLQIREETISDMLAACYGIMDNVVNGPVCQLNSSMEDDCRTMVLGSYASFLIKNHLYPNKLAAQDYSENIASLAVELWNSSIRPYQSHNFRAIAYEIVAKNTVSVTSGYQLVVSGRANKKDPLKEMEIDTSRLQTIKLLPTLNEFRIAGGIVQHTQCTQIVNLRSRVDTILKHIPSPVLESHRLRMGEVA